MELTLVGGDPALDFANTREARRGAPPVRDWLPDHPALVAWSVHAGLLDARTAARIRAGTAEADAAAAHARALALRDTVAAAFGALARGRGAPRAALDALLEHERAALAAAALRPDGGRYELAWTAAAPDRPWWPVAHAAVELLRSRRLERLKGCDRCSWLFLDLTKNRSRRWCSMADCGTSVKLERRAARRATRR